MWEEFILFVVCKVSEKFISFSHTFLITIFFFLNMLRYFIQECQKMIMFKVIRCH